MTPLYVDDALAQSVSNLLNELELASPKAVVRNGCNLLAVLDVTRCAKPEDVVTAILELRPNVAPDVLATIRAALVYQGERLVVMLTVAD